MSADVHPVPATSAAAEVPAWRLIATLGAAGALAGLFIVLAFVVTTPRIDAYRASVLRGAIEEVLRRPASADTLFLVNGALAGEAPRGAKPDAVERIYRGTDDAGRTVGYALVASEAGFADQIVLMFGWNPVTGELLGIRVLSSKETPGLGDKIEKPAFSSQFAGAIAPLRGVKDQTAKGDDASAIIMITGATISSRTVIKEINNAVVRWKPLIAAWEAKEAR